MGKRGFQGPRGEASPPRGSGPSVVIVIKASQASGTFIRQRLDTWWDALGPQDGLAKFTVGRVRSPFSLLCLVIVAGLLLTWLQNRAPVSAANSTDSELREVEPCPEVMPETCAESTPVRNGVDESVLSSASVCVDVGYLCAQLEKSGSQRILRWPEDTGRLRIRVPLPSGMAPERARELQSAAVRGIQYWQRRPFELVIDTHPTPSGTADIEISWGGDLSGSQLGLTRVRWVLAKGKPSFEVLGLTLAVRSPIGRRYDLAPEQVLLTAAHEMGHALGLPHSDSERDVMFPTNTARGLSNRDFRTLDALYRLPNGAEIEKTPKAR